MRCTTYIIRHNVYVVLYTLYSELHAMYGVYCTTYNIQCTYNVRRTCIHKIKYTNIYTIVMSDDDLEISSSLLLHTCTCVTYSVHRMGVVLGAWMKCLDRVVNVNHTQFVVNLVKQ